MDTHLELPYHRAVQLGLFLVEFEGLAEVLQALEGRHSLQFTVIYLHKGWTWAGGDAGLGLTRVGPFWVRALMDHQLLGLPRCVCPVSGPRSSTAGCRHRQPVHPRVQLVQVWPRVLRRPQGNSPTWCCRARFAGLSQPTFFHLPQQAPPSGSPNLQGMVVFVLILQGLSIPCGPEQLAPPIHFMLIFVLAGKRVTLAFGQKAQWPSAARVMLPPTSHLPELLGVVPVPQG